MSKYSSKFIDWLREYPLVVLTPIDRYLGFSAPISPVIQFSKAADKLGVPITFKDPQRIMIETTSSSRPKILDIEGEIHASVYFPFGHELLDRNMVRLVITAAESNGSLVVNDSNSLITNDDKALIAIKLANSGVKSANSWICSARSPFQYIIDSNPSLVKDNLIIGKTSGFTAGGVGVQPLFPSLDYVAPFIWSSRSDSRPKIIQNNISNAVNGNPNKVIRTYIVGGEVVGSYYTKGLGIVNCAGLTRDSKSGSFKLSNMQKNKLIEAAKIVGAGGFCRLDSTDEDNPAIYEINPLARIDAESHGLDIAMKIVEYMLVLAKTKFITENE